MAPKGWPAGRIVALTNALESGIDLSCVDRRQRPTVIGELWGGTAIEFLPANNGSWMALAADGRASAVEVYPRGNLLSHASESSFVPDPDPTGLGLSATHLAIGTVLSPQEVHAIGEREGWLVRPRRRRMGFDVIELWVENRVMLEVLTDKMQNDYLETCTVPRWNAALEKVHEAREADA